MKYYLGVIAGALTFFIGDISALMILLVTAMVIDMITGIFAASLAGELSSRTGLHGIARKFCMLMVIILANLIDVYTGTAYLRDVAMIFYIVNEVISITENMGALGVPLPDSIKDALEALSNGKNKSES